MKLVRVNDFLSYTTAVNQDENQNLVHRQIASLITEYCVRKEFTNVVYLKNKVYLCKKHLRTIDERMSFQWFLYW